MPGLFKFNELWHMDYRLLMFWYRQAVRVSRNRIVEIAYGTQIGFAADQKSFKQAIDALTLDPQELKDRKREQQINNWGALKSLGKG